MKKRRRKATSNVQRALSLCKSRGWLAESVEKWIPRGFRKDLFGFADILVVGGSKGKLVQCCNTGSKQEHLRTMARCSAAIEACLLCGMAVEMWLWTRKADGSVVPGGTFRVLIAEVGRGIMVEEVGVRSNGLWIPETPKPKERKYGQHPQSSV